MVLGVLDDLVTFKQFRKVDMIKHPNTNFQFIVYDSKIQVTM